MKTIKSFGFSFVQYDKENNKVFEFTRNYETESEISVSDIVKILSEKIMYVYSKQFDVHLLAGRSRFLGLSITKPLHLIIRINGEVFFDSLTMLESSKVSSKLKISSYDSKEFAVIVDALINFATC